MRKFGTNDALIIIALTFIVLFSSTSCTSLRKQRYFKDHEAVQKRIPDGTKISQTRTEYRLKPGDALYIRVNAPDAESVQIFNLSTREGSSATTSIGRHNSYIIDLNGEIVLPIIGKVKMDGLTLSELNEKLLSIYSEYIEQPTVQIRIVNYTVTVLGEVRSPGVITESYENLNIVEAITRAGNITAFGDRQRIMVLRHGIEGVQVNFLDMGDRKVFESPYYYLQPGDIVYVEPYRAKVLGFTSVPIGTIFSTISMILVLINFMK